MIERPLDRLNYYNGQRLEARDLKLEQEYHIRTRRWLNKSLYKQGIASGLDIRAEKDSRFVFVSPGLALDAEGREILLLEEKHIFVPGNPHKNTLGSDAEVEGLYLTIRYNEKSIEEERNKCIPISSNSKNNGAHPAWGGPALVRAEPVFNWRDALPYESSGEIVLGEVELDDKCKAVSQINTGVRRYVGAASTAKVHQYALEGERHIDKDNPGKIYFHVRRGQPKAVTLYLRAEKFSTLHYTEMGKHNHALTLDKDIQTEGPSPKKSKEQHDHDLVHLDDSKGPVSTEEEDQPGHPRGEHWHAFSSRMRGRTPLQTNGVIILQQVDLNKDINGELLPVIDGAIHEGIHTHEFKAKAQLRSIEYDHTHQFNSRGQLAAAGVTDPVYSARGGDPVKPPDPVKNPIKPLTYVDDLQVEVDGLPVKEAIIAQLKDADPSWFTYSQDKLGSGSANHPLVEKGTGEIKLDFLPKVYFLEGEHLIELSVKGEGNGGRILYNLYVE